jgi:hypothetical protein
MDVFFIRFAKGTEPETSIRETLETYNNHKRFTDILLQAQSVLSTGSTGRKEERKEGRKKGTVTSFPDDEYRSVQNI